MGESNVNLASLIGSRICHDLISPIGAITNGLELLDLTGVARGPEMALIADSVGNAGARIRFFRIAYGSAGAQAMAPAEIRAVLDDLGRDGRLRVDWAVADPQPRTLVRLAFLALQCLETAMPVGGTVRVETGGEEWTVTGQAERISVDPPLWASLRGIRPLPEITPAQVQFALLPLLAAEQGRQICTDAGETRIELRF